jgi:hypothetical protein
VKIVIEELTKTNRSRREGLRRKGNEEVKEMRKKIL